MSALPPPAPRFIAVVGGTATGKTALGAAIAEALGGEVISADSQLVYRGLDIGTAKPTAAERRGVPHHMIDEVAPTETYSVARYQQKATGIVAALDQAGKIPVVVGGTGFYVRSLLDAPMMPDIAPDPELRAQLEALAETEGNAALHQKLAAADPRRAADLHPNDRFRVIRALEIIAATGQPVAETRFPDLSQALWIGLAYADRDRMRREIDRRIERMLAAGWLDEVAGLSQAYGPDAHALHVAHGYPELLAHLQGKLGYGEAVAQIQINVHQYARRQITWYRQKMFHQQMLQNPARTHPVHWLAVDELPPDRLLAEALGRCRQAFADRQIPPLAE